MGFRQSLASLDHTPQQFVYFVAAWTTFAAVGKHSRSSLPAASGRIQPEQQQECVDVFKVRSQCDNLMNDVLETDDVQVTCHIQVGWYMSYTSQVSNFSSNWDVSITCMHHHRRTRGYCRAVILELHRTALWIICFTFYSGTAVHCTLNFLTQVSFDGEYVSLVRNKNLEYIFYFITKTSRLSWSPIQRSL